jgi:hypothetical protein
MAGASLPEAIAGLLLVFFVPGYAIARATFPEWRIRGREALLRLLETVTLAFVLSVVLTVLVGSALLLTPAGFQAYWTAPVLEVVLAAIAAVGFAAAWLRGAFLAAPPAPSVNEAGAGDEGAWELTVQLEEIGREERRIRHSLRVDRPAPAEAARLEAELADLETRRNELRQKREAEYAT